MATQAGAVRFEAQDGPYWEARKFVSSASVTLALFFSYFLFLLMAFGTPSTPATRQKIPRKEVSQRPRNDRFRQPTQTVTHYWFADRARRAFCLFFLLASDHQRSMQTAERVGPDASRCQGFSRV
ncbi:hypothetical protein GQ53DRAFT_308692 [Thozetella sp. PMI_491]|nr:hypothetical protein GQ53DRAFT_308692 [Thozetella sp. PMI_491]